MKSLSCCARRKRYFRKAMTRLNRKRLLDYNQWEKDVVYDIIGTLILGAVILGLMML